MIKNELAPGIVAYTNVFDDHMSLPEMIEESVKHKAVSWLTASVSEGTNKDIRDTDTIVIPSYALNQLPETPEETFRQNMQNIIMSIFKPALDDYMGEYGVFYDKFEEFNILKYGSGQKFINHIDDHPNYHRRISLVYYMNNDYSGGEINFPRFGITYKPNKDELLIFPSTYSYNHSVSPVVLGTRYAIVGWVK